jgi:3-demethoxyubiquinol 3-hydroxylase
VSLGGAEAIDRSQRPTPARSPQEPLSAADALQSARLMRVNHAGEVAAQALYFGQALVAKAPATQAFLQAAAKEEGDHLYWCAKRLTELNARPSLLTPVWFAGAAIIGILAASRSDAVSLGFIDETERQVEGHIDRHLARLPQADHPSRDILLQMKLDEAAHAREARERGSQPLSPVVQRVMTGVSKVMTLTASRI